MTTEPYRRTAPRITTADDVSDAFLVLFGRRPVGEDLDRVRLNHRSLLELRRHLMGSAEISDQGRQARLAGLTPDGPLVKAAFRIIRFEEVDDAEALRLASTWNSLRELLEDLFGRNDVDGRDESVDRRASRDTIVVQCKSMPRSGHHLLVNVLGEYLDRRLAYCEVYSVADCCKSQPCRLPFRPLLDNEFLLQKSHDLDFEDPFEPALKYIVQYRHPIARLQSNFDHWLRESSAGDTDEDFRRFAQAEARYYIRFWQKWVRDAPGNCLVIQYEDLVDATRIQVERVATFLGDPLTEVDAEHLRRAIEVVEVPSGSTRADGRGPAIRNPLGFRHGDAEFYRDLEEQIFEGCPGLAYSRLFS